MIRHVTEPDRDRESRIRLGRAINRERRARGWTVLHAAQLAGLDPKTWARISTGKPIREGNLNKIDKLFGLPDGATVSALQGELDLDVELRRMRPSDSDDLGQALELVAHMTVTQLEQLQAAVQAAIRIHHQYRRVSDSAPAIETVEHVLITDKDGNVIRRTATQ